MTNCISLVKNQNSLYEISSLPICINIKSFDRNNTKQLNILKPFLKNIWNFSLQFTEDDSDLKVAQQITFPGLVTYKPAPYKKRVSVFYVIKVDLSLNNCLFRVNELNCGSFTVALHKRGS